MKNLSIFGNFLKSFVFIFLTLGVLSSEGFGAAYSCQGEDVANVDSAAASASMEYDEDSSGWGKARYFKFSTAEDGEITILTTKLGGRPYIRFGTSCGGSEITHKYMNDPSYSTTFNVSKNTTYYVKIVESSLDNVLKFNIKFDFKLICNGCDCSLDTNTNGVNSPSIITALDGATTDVTTCLSGWSSNNELQADAKDYYKFTVAADGELDLTTSSPNAHPYHLEVMNDTFSHHYYYDATAINHPVPKIALSAGDSVVVYVKETGDDLDEYELNFDFKITTQGMSISNNSIAPNAVIGTLVGTLSSTPSYETYTYAIDKVDVNGTTIATNFTIDDDKLKSGAVLTDGDIFDVTIRSTDSNGVTFDETFTITVGLVNSGGDEEFDILYKYNGYTKLLLIGNTNLCAKGGYPNGTANNDPSSQVYGDGSNGGDGTNACVAADNTKRNNILWMINNDYDDTQNATDKDATTLNSTAAKLDIPAGKKVLFAGLFWQGVMGLNENVETRQKMSTIKFKHENSASYTSLTASKLNMTGQLQDGYINFYQSYVDVTEMVNTTKGGYYWIGDLVATPGWSTNDNDACRLDNSCVGSSGAFGGWSLAVVYEDEDEEMRNTTIYSGYKGLHGGNQSLTQELDGFLTPKEGDVSSTLIMFAGEGDSFSDADGVKLKNKEGVFEDLTNALNTNTDVFNSTITDRGGAVVGSYPNNSVNSLGIDIDVFNVGDTGTGALEIIGNAQTSTEMEFFVGWDGVKLGMFAMETQLYVPELCYDYAYSQNDIFLTERNYEAHDPRLISRDGRFNTNSPINVKFYIRNTEASDSISSDTKFYLLDINTSSAPYVMNTTFVTPPNSNQPYHFTDVIDTNSSNSTSASQIMHVYNGTVKAHEFFYVYFDLDPQIADINMSLNARLDYMVQMYDDAGEPLLANPMEYEIMLNEEIELCAGNPFVYIPVEGIFNVVHDSFWTDLSYDENETANTTNRAYNLPTQVVKRNGKFHILSMKDDDIFNTLQPVSTIVGIEVVDASGWADAQTTCTDSGVSRSPILWVPVYPDSTGSPFDEVVVEKALSWIGQTPHSFFSKALKSAAFRISYQLLDDNSTIYEITGSPNTSQPNGDLGSWNINNFPDIAQNDCTGDPDLTNPSTAVEKVATYCGNASKTNGMSNIEMAECMICINGRNTKRVCSRDDFAIRPETILLEMYDKNTTDIVKITESNETIGVHALVVNELAAGYDYRLRATAVSHIDNNASGYYKDFILADYNASASPKDDMLSYNWDSTLTLAQCNDINSTHGANGDFKITTAGTGEGDTSMNQVGIYTLSLTDTQWTKTDWYFDEDNNSHGLTNHVAKNFRPPTTKDCASNSNVIGTSFPNALPAVIFTGINGCDIDSTHDNNEFNNGSGIQYRNRTYQFHPYKFAIENNTTLGLNDRAYDTAYTNAQLERTNFVYMNNIGNPADENMSIHFNTNIIARGFNDTNLSNFVAGCYAEVIEINITKSNTQNTTLTQRYIMHDANATNYVFDRNLSIAPSNPVVDSNISLTTAVSTYFRKDLNGTLNTRINVNYDRNNSEANPEDITFSDIIVTNSTPLHADMKDDKKADGNLSINQSISHFYGRTAARKTRIVCDGVGDCRSGGDEGGKKNEPSVFIYYELHCNKNTNGNACNPYYSSNYAQKVDGRWYLNQEHNETHDGNLTANQEINASAVTVPNITNRNPFDKNSTHIYDMSLGLPYTAEMNSTVSPWLVHDYKTPATPQNRHTVIFSQKTEWSGRNESNATTETDSVRRVNRRTMW